MCLIKLTLLKLNNQKTLQQAMQSGSRVEISKSAYLINSKTKPQGPEGMSSWGLMYDFL